MKYIILSSVLFLSGCASKCTSHCLFGVFGPGNSAFDAIGNHYDSRDPCQYKGKPAGYQLASFCFANAGKKVLHIVDKNGKVIYKVQ
jgi:hypothetical protein